MRASRRETPVKSLAAKRPNDNQARNEDTEDISGIFQKVKHEFRIPLFSWVASVNKVRGNGTTSKLRFANNQGS